VSAADVDKDLSWGAGLLGRYGRSMMLQTHRRRSGRPIEHFLPAVHRPQMTGLWKALGSPVLTPEVQEEAVDSVHAEGRIGTSGTGAERDEVLIGLPRATQQGRQGEPNRNRRAGRLRTRRLGGDPFIRPSKVVRLSSYSNRSLNMPLQTARSKTAARSRCRRVPTASSISWSTFSRLRRTSARPVRCGPIWRPGPAVINKYWFPMTLFPFEWLQSVKGARHRRGSALEGLGCAGA